MNILDKNKDIEFVNFNPSQYIAEVTDKIQIFLHHTAGNSNPYKVFKDWETNPERIATCVTIAGIPNKLDTFKDGQIVQGYSSKYWAYHLGLKESTFYKFNLPYKSLDKKSIGIEICNWGQVTRKNGKFYTWANTAIPDEYVITLPTPFRGYRYFHNYTDEQIISVEKLLRYWGAKYNIPLSFNPEMFEVNTKALRGAPGIWAHVSVRYDKVDIYPHPKLIEMLKSL